MVRCPTALGHKEMYNFIQNSYIYKCPYSLQLIGVTMEIVIVIQVVLNCEHPTAKAFQQAHSSANEQGT